LHQDRLSEPSAHRSEDLLTDSPRHGRNGSGPAQAVANRTHGSEPDRPVPSEYPSGLVESFQTIADPVRQSRRLPDRILVAVHQACDIGALDIARALLDVMNDVVREIAPGSPSAGRRAFPGNADRHAGCRSGRSRRPCAAGPDAPHRRRASAHRQTANPPGNSTKVSDSKHILSQRRAVRRVPDHSDGVLRESSAGSLALGRPTLLLISAIPCFPQIKPARSLASASASAPASASPRQYQRRPGHAV
jgi:hypothetical protein